ncbi:PREDICTED: dual specificity protein phosphatase 3-like [Branchiostoma belcheri]|uniref:Dual specificity protein phosphatase n=1 Tax=Branchiostoma belcheri TaxID=7741 RepID=A0A6P5A0S3_BRABE|nr:PREDICTED: dual specificity protein phosphatase 3-like [Branchiostoma belcheri]
MATDVQDRGCEGEPPPLPPRKARETAGSQSSSQLPHVAPSTSDDALTSPDRVPPTSCRVEELRRIITGPFGLVLMPSRSHDEVFPRLYVGEGDIAKKLPRLQELGITHVVNAAHNIGVFTGPHFYRDTNIQYLGVEAVDHDGFDMMPYFIQTADFIEDALRDDTAKVLVHCLEGFSRSATLVIAYLMLKQGMMVQEAVRTVRDRREVCPNDGFLKQLCILNDKLLSSRSKQTET